MNATALTKTGPAPEWKGRQAELRLIAGEVVKAGGVLADKFRAMVIWLRKSGMTPDEARPVLVDAGFNPVRVSNIIGIVALPEAEAKPYIAGEIGWRPVLEKVVATRAAAKKAKGGKSKKLKKSQFPRLMQLHAKLIRRYPAMSGVHVFEDSCMVVFSLKASPYSAAWGEYNVKAECNKTAKQ